MGTMRICTHTIALGAPCAMLRSDGHWGIRPLMHHKRRPTDFATCVSGECVRLELATQTNTHTICASSIAREALHCNNLSGNLPGMKRDPPSDMLEQGLCERHGHEGARPNCRNIIGPSDATHLPRCTRDGTGRSACLCNPGYSQPRTPWRRPKADHINEVASRRGAHY